MQNFKATTFDISQPKVSKITEILLPILDDTLKKLSTAVKKTHTVKNNLLCDNTQYVFYLSPIESGSVHDKKIADQYPINLTENSTVKPNNISIEQPFKNSENHKLTFTECIYNKMLSATRVIIEHDNSGVKRLRIIKNTTRFYSFEKRNKIMLIA